MHLPTDSTKDAFFQTIEAVEATPGSNLAPTNEDTTYGLEIERLVATKYEHKSAELNAESFDELGLPYVMKTY
jgi:hypothetical protein